MEEKGLEVSKVIESDQEKAYWFSPCPSTIEAFQAELDSHHTSKGTVQFPYEKELPLELIGRMVRFPVAEQDSDRKKQMPA